MLLKETTPVLFLKTRKQTKITIWKDHLIYAGLMLVILAKKYFIKNKNILKIYPFIKNIILRCLKKITSSWQCYFSII